MVKTTKAFREYLNRTCTGKFQGKNSATGKNLGNRTRSYGDYLYNQDRDMFNAEYQEWLKTND